MSAHHFLLAEDAGQTPAAGSVARLSEERGLLLQMELLRAYQSTSFQHKLGKIWVAVLESHTRAKQVRSSVKMLIRQTQARVLQSYSFHATDEDIEALATDLERYPDGPDAPALGKIVSEIMDKVQYLGFARKPSGEMSCPCLTCRKQGGTTAASHLTKEKAEGGTTAASHLTKKEAEALLSQLQQAVGSRRFHQLAAVLPDEQGCLLVQKPGGPPTAFRSWLPPKTSQALLIVYAETLARFGFDQGEEGVGQMWWALRPFFGEPAIMERATAVIQCLGMAARRAWEKVQPHRTLVVNNHLSQTLLSKDRAMALQLELFRKFSCPPFQVALNALHRSHHPCSAGFGERLADLLAPVYASVLPLYGFAGNEDGLMAMILATGRMLREPDLQVLLASIDALLYGAEPGVGEARINEMAERLHYVDSNSEEEYEASEACGDQAQGLDPPAKQEKPLGKQKVLMLLREHVAAFSTPEFQRKVAALRSGAASWGGPGKETDETAKARAQLALTAQAALLPKFGLEGSPRGAYSMLQLCIPYVFDPQVARLTYAVHFLLGMDEPEALVAKLRNIQGEMEMSLPSNL